MNTDITYIRLINRVYIKKEFVFNVYKIFSNYGIGIVIGNSCYVHEMPFIDRIYLAKNKKLNIVSFKKAINDILNYLIVYNNVIYMQLAIEYEIIEKNFISDLMYMEIKKLDNTIVFDVLIEKTMDLSPGQQSLVKSDSNPLDVLFHTQ